MKKALRILLYIILAIALLIGGAILVLSEKKPESTPSEKGNLLAKEMQMALNKDGWDSLRYLQWTFVGRHDYLFDKQNNYARVKAGDNVVLMDLDQQTGKAYDGEVELKGEAKDKAIQKAWSNWCNDSFWMFAPYKVFDPNTTRSVVPVEEGTHGLMVQYNGGGVTPGDSYLWILDDQHMPIAYKMWVEISPVGGSYATWEDWSTMPSGAKLATKHKIGPITLEMTNVKEGNTLAELGYPENLFAL